MKFIEINKKLNEKIENIYNLTGEDDYLIKHAILNIKAATIKDFDEFNYQLLTNDCTRSALDAALSTLPMANDYRMVVLFNPTADQVKFINEFDFDGSVVLVLVNAEKLKGGEVVDCSKLDRIDINRYILNYLKKVNLSIEEQAMDYLIDACNSNMSKIVNELNKIVSYCADMEVITLDVVLNLVANTNEYVIYMLTTAIDNKDYSTFQKIVSSMGKTNTANEIFSYLGRYFRRMQYVAVNKNDDEVAKYLGIKPYAVKMSRKEVAKNGIKYYINLYQNYIDLDFQIKSGKISAANALYRLIF